MKQGEKRDETNVWKPENLHISIRIKSIHRSIHRKLIHKSRRSIEIERRSRRWSVGEGRRTPEMECGEGRRPPEMEETVGDGKDHKRLSRLLNYSTTLIAHCTTGDNN
ncbi:hypothetical protein L6452_18379 [Arctium lappa]|uniref:Uncharacterized protein n=1 Tax=Arctium lappa TaxID=4217 RepID=A0ACB9C658_ARCLA|nr:hypothetical protein L6452_18379 [Arctium lappa]